MRSGIGHRASGIGLLAAALIAAACTDSTVQECLESNATAYPVNLPGDTSNVFRWPAAHQPVQVYAEPTGELAANVDAAITLWLGAFRCGELSVQRVTDSAVADIIVRNPPQAPALRMPQRAMFADSTTACEGETRVDSLDLEDNIYLPFRVYVTPAGIDAAETAACYRFVTAHELGHTLGLFEHSTAPEDLMFHTPFRRALSLNDRYTIQLLYHRSAVSMVPLPR